jgi:hypothetical protein
MKVLLLMQVRLLNRHAFTLVETMVAIMCMSILMGPIFYVYRSGSRTSLGGMVKAEITLEARRIIRQIHDDLKYSVFFIGYPAPKYTKSTDYFPEILSGDLETSFSVLRFPLHGSVDDAIESIPDGVAFRKPILITYSLKKEAAGDIFYSLYRKEGAMSPNQLSKRVNFFEIRENPMSIERTSWFVTLQLAETVQALPDDINVIRLQEKQGKSVKAAERRLIDRTKNVQIADFFDVVASEYYSFFRKSNFIPNWHTLLKAP